MILYFSATGNCKYIAEQIASATGENCISIVDCIKEERYLFSDEKILGIITPTYFLRLPRIVFDYLTKIKINNCDYTFFIASYGTTTGQAGSMAKKIITSNNQHFDAVGYKEAFDFVTQLVKEKEVIFEQIIKQILS